LTLNAEHGLYGLPKANAGAFTLNAKQGLDGTPKINDKFTHKGFYTQCVAWRKKRRWFYVEKIPRYKSIYFSKRWTQGVLKPNERKQINLYTVEKNVRPRLPVYSG
jgi:hypothetical protein